MFSPINMKKILITGVAGMIGANLARYFLDKGYEVIGVDDFSGGYVENVPKGVVIYNEDCCNPYLVGIVKNHRPDYVFHLAAYAAEGLSPFIRNFNYRNNVLASVNVINACIQHDVKKLIFTSSMAVYGHSKAPFTEDMIPCPADPYGIAKYTVEMDLFLAKQQFGLDYTIVRPHNVVGIYQNIWDKYRNVIGIWIRQAMNNEPLTIYGDGTQTRAFSDVNYLLPCLEKLMEPTDQLGSDLFNIGADQEFTILDTAETLQKVAKKFGFNPIIKHLEARHEVKHAFCDHTRAKTLLGFKDKTNLYTLIATMFEWALAQPKRTVYPMKYEITKNMYSFWK